MGRKSVRCFFILSSQADVFGIVLYLRQENDAIHIQSFHVRFRLNMVRRHVQIGLLSSFHLLLVVVIPRVIRGGHLCHVAVGVMEGDISLVEVWEWTIVGYVASDVQRQSCGRVDFLLAIHGLVAAEDAHRHSSEEPSVPRFS